jgi:phage terminase small subunit
MTCKPEHSPRHPDFEPGNQVARRHGVWSADATDEAARVVGDLLPAADIDRYPLVALIFAETWVRWRRAVADIAARGEMLGEGTDAKAHPLLPVEARLRRDLLDLVGRFGLDPRAEAELARDRADAARVTVDLESVVARGRAAWAARDGEPIALTVGDDHRPETANTSDPQEGDQ